MINKIKKIKGLTLIETIIYVAIFSMVIFMILSFSNIIINSRIQSQTILEVNNQGNKIIRTITQEVRNAKSINIPTVGSLGQTLSLETYDISKNPTTFSINGNGILTIEEGGNGPIELINDKVFISNLVFENVSGLGEPGAVKIRFTLDGKKTGQQNYSSNFYSSASTR